MRGLLATGVNVGSQAVARLGVLLIASNLLGTGSVMATQFCISFASVALLISVGPLGATATRAVARRRGLGLPLSELVSMLNFAALVTILTMVLISVGVFCLRLGPGSLSMAALFSAGFCLWSYVRAVEFGMGLEHMIIMRRQISTDAVSVLLAIVAAQTRDWEFSPILALLVGQILYAAMSPVVAFGLASPCQAMKALGRKAGSVEFFSVSWASGLVGAALAQAPVLLAPLLLVTDQRLALTQAYIFLGVGLILVRALSLFLFPALAAEGVQLGATRNWRTIRSFGLYPIPAVLAVMGLASYPFALLLAMPISGRTFLLLGFSAAWVALQIGSVLPVVLLTAGAASVARRSLWSTVFGLLVASTIWIVFVPSAGVDAFILGGGAGSAGISLYAVWSCRRLRLISMAQASALLVFPGVFVSTLAVLAIGSAQLSV